VFGTVRLGLFESQLRLWHTSDVPIFLEKFLLPLLVVLVAALAITNPMKFDVFQRITGTLAVVFIALFLSHSLQPRNRSQDSESTVTPRDSVSVTPASKTGDSPVPLEEIASETNQEEQSAASPSPIASPLPPLPPPPLNEPQSRLRQSQCTELGNLVELGDTLLSRLVAERASDSVRADVDNWRSDSENWLKKNAPIQAVLFSTAPASSLRPTNYPSQYGPFYGRLRGQLNALRDILNKVCG
jgi:hypothetical protein